MRDGVNGGPVSTTVEYANLFNASGSAHDVSPLVIAAIRANEASKGDPPDIVSGDGGHGIMQLTSSYPDDWADPKANIEYATAHFIAPAWDQWNDLLQGEDLVRAIAATYNAGYGNAWAGHLAGDVDRYTTNRYGERALANYRALLPGA